MMTTQFQFRDRRIVKAADIILLGNIKLLSLDVFDTLLLRRVPKPPDVFLRLGMNLKEQNLLGVGQTPESFAAIRYQTEYTARATQQRQHNNREVTLAEIYAAFPPHVTASDAIRLVDAEIETEHELCFANPEIINLAILARQHGVKLCLISNSYFNQKTLADLLRVKAPTLPNPDEFFVSCEHRCGKRDGLMQKMLDRFVVKPDECLHLGDDPISDRETAEKLGIPCIFMGWNGDSFSDRLAEEHPVQWQDRVRYFAETGGDHGTTWLRRSATHLNVSPEFNPQQRTFYNYGAQMLGPLLTGFAAWLQARLAAENTQRVYGLTREGHFLTDLVSTVNPHADCRILAISRLSAALASFHPDYPEHLEDFLTRRGFWTLGALMEQLGFIPDQAQTFGNVNTTLEEMPARDLTEKLLKSSLANDLFQRSAERRKRLLNHLRTIGALDNSRLYMVDLGYAATIQRALQRIFTIENLNITTHGLYLASAHVSLATQCAGGIVEGFLAQNGNPNDFARAFCRSPEIVELSCMPAYGTVVDYQDNGTPIYATDATPQNQLYEVQILQEGVKDFTVRFSELIKNDTNAPDFLSAGWQEHMRAIATRMVIYPTAEEARLFGHWLADSDLGLASPRPIICDTPPMPAEQLVAMPRRDLPWLYGIAAGLDPKVGWHVGNLMMRKKFC
jgi:FMN phosphatase YigB (HAD superfamily)